MKYFKLGIIVLSLFVAGSVAQADALMLNTHALDRCVKVTNVNSFPAIVLVAKIDALTGGIPNYQVDPNKCLEKGYKFNTLGLYWAKKGYSKDSELTLITKEIEPYGGYISDSDHRKGEKVFYQLVKLGANNYALYKYQTVTSYNDGTPDKTENFTIPTNSDSCVDIKRNLSFGMYDSGSLVTRTGRAGDIRKLQDFLIARGYLKQIELRSGRVYFGAKTRAAVRSFQAKNNLVKSSFVNLATRKKIKEISCNNNDYVRPIACPETAILCPIGSKVVTETPLRGCPVQKCVPESPIVDSCIPEGGNLGIVHPKNTSQCCAGLVGGIPLGMSGGRGTCLRPGTVTVWTPNNGERFEQGSAQRLSWVVSGQPQASVDLYLVQDAVCSNSLSCSTAEPIAIERNLRLTGDPYLWTVGANEARRVIAPGKYKLRVCIAGSMSSCDSSDKDFEIIAKNQECRAIWSNCSCGYICSDIPDNQRADCARDCGESGALIFKPTCAVISGMCHTSTPVEGSMCRINDHSSDKVCAAGLTCERVDVPYNHGSYGVCKRI